MCWQSIQAQTVNLYGRVGMIRRSRSGRLVLLLAPRFVSPPPPPPATRGPRANTASRAAAGAIGSRSPWLVFTCEKGEIVVEDKDVEVPAITLMLAKLDEVV